MSQGQGSNTEWKERGIAAGGVAVSARIFAAKFKHTRYIFWLFDLFSGAGHNILADCPGSPRAMLSVVRALELKYRLHTVDIDKAACEALMKHPEIACELGKRIFVHHGDNAEFAPAALELVKQHENPSKAMGLWLCDPNDAVINMSLLRDMGRNLPCMDVALNITATTIKRVNGAGWSMPTVGELIEQCQKSHWLIRKPTGKLQWSLLIGRNIDVGDYRSMGFHKLNSDMGQEYLRILTLTRAELKDQNRQRNGDLPFL